MDNAINKKAYEKNECQAIIFKSNVTDVWVTSTCCSIIFKRFSLCKITLMHTWIAVNLRNFTSILNDFMRFISLKLYLNFARNEIFYEENFCASTWRWKQFSKMHFKVLLQHLVKSFDSVNISMKTKTSHTLNNVLRWLIESWWLKKKRI